MPELGGLFEVVLALGAFELGAGEVERFAVGSQIGDRLFLVFIPGAEFAAGSLELGGLGFERLAALDRSGILLVAQTGDLDLELHHAALVLVELLGAAVDLGAQRGRSLVDEVDRLVGQEAVGDVLVRQHRGGDERAVPQLHAVVDLIALLEAAQNADRVLDARRIDQDRLETALERGVLFDVFAVFVERGRADAVQFAAGEHRLEQIARVHRAVARSRADDGVEFVDEEDHPALGRGDLLEHRLEPLLEFAAVLGSGDQRAHVERDDLTVLEALGHVSAHDPAREPLDDRGLADAGLADQHRVVLGPARQDLDHAPDLVVTADHRVELVLHREFGEVARILFERLESSLGIGSRDPLIAADRLQRPEHLVIGDARVFEHGRGRRAAPEHRQKQMLDAHVFVVHLLGLPGGSREHLAEFA